MASAGEDQSVDAGAKLRESVRPAGETHRFGRAEHRDLDADRRIFGDGQRLESRVTECGGGSVGRHVVAQCPVRDQAADAAAEFTADGQGDEAGGLLVQPGRFADGDRRQLELLGDGRAGQRQQHLPGVLGDRHRLPLVPGDRRVAHHASTITGGVTRVAGAQQRRTQPAAPGHREQPADRIGSARPVRVDRPLAVQDGLDRLGIQASGLAIGMVVGKVGTDHDEGFRPTPAGFEHIGDRTRIDIADHQRHHGEIAQHPLQEG
ncbi:hypothetical protein SDC9_142168 [bioreactor metagenome]|uniref:Uncharacterized protein n=1 Tax=bioreactor metagenome TaxID=1076179 RepID=A0A645E0G8_9ZZZZ